MMVSFRYFLFLAILSPSVLGADNLNCTNKADGIRPWEMCCNGDIYRLREPIQPVASCNVEPKNKTLSFADSGWLVYDCNIRNLLNSTDLTLQSYINLLVRARNASQSFLSETLKFQSDISENTAGEDEYDKIQTIKLYQRKCLEALEQACTFGSMNSTNVVMPLDLVSMDFKTRFTHLQQYQECNDKMSPYSGLLASYDRRPVPRGFEDKCKQEFYHMLGNVTFHRYRYNIFTLCRAGGSPNLDIIKSEITKPTLDLEGIVGSFFPAFWSKWVKNAVKNMVFEGLKEDYSLQDLENMESLIRKKIEERINREVAEGIYGKSLTNKREIVQAVMIFSINDAFRPAARNICRIDADRKE